MSLLAVEQLDARHGLLKAVRDVDLRVAEGEILALVGANGAGKTTLLRTIAGAHRPAGGRIVFDGKDVTALRAHQRVALGIALVPEGRRLFAGLTVEENLRVGGDAGRAGPWNIEALLEVFPMLKARLKTPAGLLSGGEQQATSIGRAMMTNPKLLLLDEVSLGLAPLAIDSLYRSLTALFSSGTALVLVEQNLSRVLGVATRICCMLEGRIVLERDAKLATRAQITEAYFGLRRDSFRGNAAVIWLDQIIQGTLLGGYYALIACGLSLMFGVMRIINLAHGDFAILGVFAVWLLVTQTGISPFPALLAVIPLMGLLGWALQHWVFERSLRAGPLVPLLATFGLAIVIENLLFEVFSADTRSLAPEIGDLAFSSWTLTDQIYVGHLAVLIFVVAVILLVGLQLFLKWTALGRAIRATAEDPDTAELVRRELARRLRDGRRDRGRDHGDCGHLPRHAGDFRSVFRARATDFRL